MCSPCAPTGSSSTDSSSTGSSSCCRSFTTLVPLLRRRGLLRLRLLPWLARTAAGADASRRRRDLLLIVGGELRVDLSSQRLDGRRQIRHTCRCGCVDRTQRHKACSCGC